MREYRVLAQSYVDNRRFAKVIPACTDADAVRIASVELETAGFYVVQIDQLGG